jgi:hypothetical protein
MGLEDYANSFWAFSDPNQVVFYGCEGWASNISDLQ